MARTRSGKASATSTGSQSRSTTASRYTLAPESDTPSRLLVLPTQATSDARVVSLPNPRYLKSTRYLVCPQTGIYEFTKVSAPKAAPRSWLIVGQNNPVSQAEAGDRKECDGEQSEKITAPPLPPQSAKVTRAADLYIASKIDPVFLLLPSLSSADQGQSAGKAGNSSGPAKRMFLSCDDHLDKFAEGGGSGVSEVLRWGKMRQLFESRMACVCDTVDAGDETMYRLSEEKLLEMVLSKARRVALPKSMDERFVRRQLEAPVLSVRSGVGAKPSRDEAAATPSDDAQSATESSNDSQTSVSSTDTAASDVSDASTAATSIAEEVVTAAMQAPEEVTRLQQMRVAFNFICSSYIPPALTVVLRKLLAERSATSKSSVDFAPLDKYLAQLSELRQEAAATRSALDFSRKRTLDEEDEERAEKKRKKEEEDKRKKAGESRGLRELKKVNVSGMRKLSEFFKRK